jgi:hypothetical protein
MIEAIPLNHASDLAATSTGNNTHTAVRTDANETVAFEMEVTAIGATPTVTWKIQGSMDGTSFWDVAYVTDANDTVAVAGRTMTTVSSQIQFLSNPVARRYKFYRLVTSANTNVTYRARAHRIAKP